MTALFEWDNIEMPVQGKSNEWYTPARYVEAARKVLGEIDLDPASCAVANQIVKAKMYYTQEDNGLAQAWYGRIWLNPPFGTTNGKSNIGLFTRRLVEEYQAGHIEQAILLSTSKTDTSWFTFLWDYPICFTNHVVNFYQTRKRSRVKAAHFHGTIFVYFGSDEQKFIEVFSDIGTIAKRVSVPKPKVAPLSLWEVLP